MIVNYNCNFCDQVRVRLEQPSGNYYILSRYLISRVLTVIKIPYVKVRVQLFMYIEPYSSSISPHSGAHL